MKISESFKSVRFRLFATLCVSIFLIIVCLIIVNNVVLESFYLYTKTSNAAELCDDINDYYNGIIQYDINQRLEEQERKNNIDILILDEMYGVVYCNNLDIINSINSFNYNLRSRVIYTKENITLQSVEENRNNKYLILSANLDNGYTTYIKIQVQPIKETVKISNNLLISFPCFNDFFNPNYCSNYCISNC